MSVKNKAMGTPYVVYYIQPSMAANTSTSIGKKGGLYIYINVGLSTLLVSTDRGNAKALTRGTSYSLAPRFCFVYP